MTTVKKAPAENVAKQGVDIISISLPVPTNNNASAIGGGGEGVNPRRDFLRKLGILGAGVMVGTQKVLGNTENKESIEWLTVKDVIHTPPNLDRLSDHCREALETPQIQFVVPLFSKNGYNVMKKIPNFGGDAQALSQTQEGLDNTKEYFENSGCKKWDAHLLPEIYHVDENQYPDDATQGLDTANVWMNDQLEAPGSYLHTMRAEIAEKYNIPTEKIFFQFFCEHNVGGGAARTNFAGKSYAMKTDAMFEPNRKGQIFSTTAHEYAKQVMGEVPKDTIGTDRRGIIVPLPTNADGSQVYHIQKDGVGLDEVATPSHVKKWERLTILRTTEIGATVTLVLSNGTKLTFPWGEEGFDVFGTRDWRKPKDRFMEEQLVDENGENLPDTTLTLDKHGDAILRPAVPGSEVKIFGAVPDGLQISEEGNVLHIHVDSGDHPPETTFQVIEHKRNPLSGALQVSLPRTITIPEVLVDTKGPELLSEGLWPQGEMEENDTNFELEMHFSEEVVRGSGKIRLRGTYKGSDGQGFGTDFIEFDATELVIVGSKVSLPVFVKRFTEYYVNIDEGVLKDRSGNSFSGIDDNTTWTFETKDWATGTREEYEKSEFKVYPNPFTDHINIENAHELERVQLFNSLSRSVLNIKNPASFIDIRRYNLNSGLFTICLFNRNGKLVKTQKLTKR